MKITDKNVFVFDLESTGLDTKKDKIVELAIYNPASQNKTFSSLVNPQMKIPQESINIHGISDEIVKDSPLFPDIFNRMLEICGDDCYLIAHNGEIFDEPMFRYEALRHNCTIPSGWKFIDSLQWSKKYLKFLPKHNLQYLREYFKIPANTAHRALDDTIVLWKVFDLMTDDLEANEIYSILNIDPSKRKMPFGKYKNKLISTLPDNYIEWLYSTSIINKPENAKIKETLEKLGMNKEYTLSLNII